MEFGPTTLLTRFAEELRRVLGIKGLRGSGVKGAGGRREVEEGLILVSLGQRTQSNGMSLIWGILEAWSGW